MITNVSKNIHIIHTKQQNKSNQHGGTIINQSPVIIPSSNRKSANTHTHTHTHTLTLPSPTSAGEAGAHGWSSLISHTALIFLIKLLRVCVCLLCVCVCVCVCVWWKVISAFLIGKTLEWLTGGRGASEIGNEWQKEREQAECWCPEY